MERNLILTGWGRSEYAAAAAVALKAVGEAEVIGVSMRRLVSVLEMESVGRSAVFVLGVGLGDEEEAFAAVARQIAARGVRIVYLVSAHQIKNTKTANIPLDFRTEICYTMCK